MKNSQNLILLVILFLIPIVGCSAPGTIKTKPVREISSDRENGTQNTSPALDLNKCICIDLWLPVCGEDGKTYSNSCFAKCARVKFTQGTCEKKDLE